MDILSQGVHSSSKRPISQTLAQNLDLIQGWIDVLPTNKGALVKPNSAQTFSTLKVLGEKQIYYLFSGLQTNEDSSV